MKNQPDTPEYTGQNTPPEQSQPDRTNISARLTGRRADQYKRIFERYARQKARKSELPLTHKEVVERLVAYATDNRGYTDVTDAYPI